MIIIQVLFLIQHILHFFLSSKILTHKFLNFLISRIMYRTYVHTSTSAIRIFQSNNTLHLGKLYITKISPFRKSDGRNDQNISYFNDQHKLATRTYII